MFDSDTTISDFDASVDTELENLDEVFTDDHAEAWAWATDDVADIRFS